MTGAASDRARQRERLAALLLDAVDAVQEDTLSGLLRAGEHRVMLEILLDQRSESSLVLSRETLVEIRSLSHELGVSAPERRWIDERLATMPS
ncbi:MAG: hypothetical protein J0L92_01550 [Deltaproteobacteria bacterium]|nr:hypothetical protein [Deltaproteobacteria bacterium]